LVVSYLEGFSAQDFEGGGTRVITTPRWEGKVMSGADYFFDTPPELLLSHHPRLRHPPATSACRSASADYLGPLTQRTP